MKKNRIQNEGGMITVEAVLTLVPFILVVLGIISFINIFMVHNKIQYAMFEAGSELSSYTYLYQALGIRSADAQLNSDIDKETENIDTAITQTMELLNQIQLTKGRIGSVGSKGVTEVGNDVKNVISDGKGTAEAGNKLFSHVQEMLMDPAAIVRGGVYLGIEWGENELKSYLCELLAGGMVEVYLDQSYTPTNTMSADEYLKAYGVADGMNGLDFGESKLFQDDEQKMIDIVVEYNIEVYFFKLFMKDPTIHVVQRCAVPAWLDGDGSSY